MEIIIGIFLTLGIIGYVIVGVIVGVMGAESYGKDGELTTSSAPVGMLVALPALDPEILPEPRVEERDEF